MGVGREGGARGGGGWVGEGQKRQDEERERRPDQTQVVRAGKREKLDTFRSG